MLPLRFVSTQRDELRPQSVFRFPYDKPNPTFTVFKGPILLIVVSPLFAASSKDAGL